MTEQQPLSCWVVSDGRAGVENQALGLAEALGRISPLSVVRKRIKIREPWRRLPRALWGDPFARLDTAGDALAAPWPDIWIAAGRLSIPFTLAVKGRNPVTFTVQTQDPKTPSREFDLVIPPEHDGLSGENVFPIIGSPNRIAPARLEDDARRARAALGPLAAPLVAVLIGGASKAYRMTPAIRAQIVADLLALRDTGASLLITASRRTAPEHAQALRDALHGDRVFFWDGAPVGELDNPYFGFLGLADFILVTEDSVNMATEAAATGKPVYILAMEGGAPKFDRLHRALRKRGATRAFDGRLESWTYEPLRETDRAAAEIMRLMNA